MYWGFTLRIVSPIFGSVLTNLLKIKKRICEFFTNSLCFLRHHEAFAFDRIGRAGRIGIRKEALKLLAGDLFLCKK